MARFSGGSGDAAPTVPEPPLQLHQRGVAKGDPRECSTNGEVEYLQFTL